MTVDLNVLVLGVGGNVSQGILKALAASTLRCRVVGACVSPLAAGLYTVDKAIVSPLAADPAFLPWLAEVCRAERIDAILSGVEPVLSVLSRSAELIREESGAIAIVSRPETLAVGDDKLLTCKWLEERSFNFPRYAPSDDLDAIQRLHADCGFPLVVKPREGRSSGGISIIREWSDVKLVAGRPGYVVQEHLGDTESEFTVGAFCDREGRVRGTIAMRRELLQGTTHRVIVGEFPEVREEAFRISAALRPRGPCNVQLRLSRGRPVCFEINVRFSGTTPIRARLGFNDVEATLRHFVLGELATELPNVTSGIVVRYWNEIYVDPGAHARLVSTGRLESPHDYPLVLEPYGMV